MIESSYEEADELVLGDYYMLYNCEKVTLYVVAWRNGINRVIGTAYPNKISKFTVTDGEKFRILLRITSIISLEKLRL